MTRPKKKPPKKRVSGGNSKSFVVEYLQDHNSTAAAIRCGYSPRGAASWGSRLAKKYKAEIQRAIEASNARLEVTADRIRQELAEIAYLPLEGILSFQLRAKVKCLELLAKHSGMLIERHEVQTGEGGVVVYIPDHDRATNGVSSAAEEGCDDT